MISASNEQLQQQLEYTLLKPDYHSWWISKNAIWHFSPGSNTPQGTNYTATCLPSRKLSKLDEPDMQDTAGETGTSS